MNNLVNDECKLYFMFTLQPIKSTEAQVQDFDAVVHIQDDPVLECLKLYSQYDKLFDDDGSFVNYEGLLIYLKSKLVLWKAFDDFWSEYQGEKRIIHWKRLIRDPMMILKGLLDSETIELVGDAVRNKMVKWKVMERRRRRLLVKLKRLIAREDLIKLTRIDTDYLSKEIHLLMTFYNANNTARANELKLALYKNVRNPFVSKVHLWLDGDNNETMVPVKSDKIKFIYSQSQPVYRDLFEYSNLFFNNCCVFVIQNSDIYWTESIEKVKEIEASTVFSLSRHSNLKERPETRCAPGGLYDRNYCLDYGGSHDSFIFLPPIDPTILNTFYFKQNSWGAENTVIEGLRHAGYRLYNPCYDVVGIHVHCSNFRPFPGKKVRPPNMGSRREKKNLFIHPKSNPIYKFKLSKLNQSNATSAGNNRSKIVSSESVVRINSYNSKRNEER